MEVAGLGPGQQISPDGRDPGHNPSRPPSGCAADHNVGDGAPGAHPELQIHSSPHRRDAIAQQHCVSPDHRPQDRGRLVAQTVEGHEWTGVSDASRCPPRIGAPTTSTFGATAVQTARVAMTATPSPSPGLANHLQSWLLRKTILLSNGNQCYVNSLALALLHTCTQDRVWQGIAGDFAPALQAILASHRPQSLRNLYAWQMALRGWLRPTLQHDVCELYHFLRMRFNMPGFAGTWEARAIMDHSCRCLERNPLTTPISLTLQRPSSIQALINEWHSGEVGVQALTEIPVKLALQLKRYNQVGDKLRHSVQIGETLQLPVFLDNIQSQLLTYRVDAIVFHLGDRPNEGHYQTALQQAGQWFITNDGCKPTRAGAQTLAATVAQNSYLILCSKI